MRPSLYHLVVFDFCDTLTNFQTGDGFVKYVVAKRNSRLRRIYLKFIPLLVQLRFFAVLSKLLPVTNLEKRANLLALRGLKYQYLDVLAQEFLENEIIPNYHPELMSRLKAHRHTGDILVVSSGGYDMYLRYFCKSAQIEYLNSTKIAFKGDRCLGRFDGPDCMEEQKVIELNKLIAEHQWSVDKMTVYSDSISDMPLFKMASSRFVISEGNSQAWAEDNGFNEIIVK